MDGHWLDRFAARLAASRDRRSVVRGAAASALAVLAGPIRSRPAAASSTIAWPFDPADGQWTIIQGYRGPTHSTGSYDELAFDLGKCPAGEASHDTGRCGSLPARWEDTAGAIVYSPVGGSVAWTDNRCFGLSIDIDGHPGYRISLMHIELDGGIKTGDHLAAGQRLGTVLPVACIDNPTGHHIHMVLYRCRQDDCRLDRGAGDREAVAFAGAWAIAGCDYPNDGRTVNQHRGMLIPCAAHPEEFYIDMGRAESEAGFALSGWGEATTNLAASRDRTARFQTLRGDNSVTFSPVKPGASYELIAEVDDGSCDDSFEIRVSNEVLYRHQGRHGYVARLHTVTIPGLLVTTDQLTVVFRNTAADNCGLAGVYNIRLTRLD